MRSILKGATDQSVVIRIVDSGDGTPETGVEHNTSGIDLWYRREGAAKVSITEAALSALTDAHSDGGIEHIGDGYYRLDLPDAAVASGADGVTVGGTVTGMVVIGCYVPLVSYNPYDGVRLGLTALPNAAADAAGGLPISDAGGLDLDAQRSDVAAILVDTGTTLDGRIPAALVGGRMDASVGAMATDTLTATALAASAVTEMQAGLSTLDAAGVRTAVGLAAANLDTQLAAIAAYIDTEVAAILAAVDTEVAAIKAKTDNLPASPAAVGSAMTLTSGERDSIAAALLDLTSGIETSITPRQALRAILASVAGVLSGAATTTITLKNPAGGTTRLTVTVDADGNRSAVVTNL